MDVSPTVKRKNITAAAPNAENKDKPARKRTRPAGPGLAALVGRVMTFGYFIPMMLKLVRDDRLSETDALARALQWVKLGYVRHAATLIALLAALKSFSSFYAQRC
jgi:hypothetical protein